MSTLEKGEFQVNVVTLRQQKEVFSDWYHLKSGLFRIRVVYQKKDNGISVAVVSTGGVTVAGTIKINGKGGCIVKVQDDVAMITTYGVCNIIPNEELCSIFAKVEFDLLFTPESVVLGSENQEILNPFVSRQPVASTSAIEQDPDFVIDQYLTLRPTWSIDRARLVSREDIVTKKVPLIHHPGVHWWLSFGRPGAVHKRNDNKLWSMTFHIDRANVGLKGYFVWLTRPKNFLDFGPVSVTGSVSSISFSKFRFPYKGGDNFLSRSHSVKLHFEFKINLRVPDDGYNYSRIKEDVSEPMEISQAVEESNEFDIGQLLQAGEAIDEADAIIHARSERIMPVHTLILRLHSKKLYGLYQQELEKDIQNVEGKNIIINLDFSAAAMRKVIGFFYHGKFDELPTGQEMHEMVQFIAVYETKHLESYFVRYLESTVNRNTVCGLLRAADEAGLEPIMEVCERFIASCHGELAMLKDVENIPPLALLRVIKKVKQICPAAPISPGLPTDVSIKDEIFDPAEGNGFRENLDNLEIADSIMSKNEEDEGLLSDSD